MEATRAEIQNLKNEANAQKLEVEKHKKRVDELNQQVELYKEMIQGHTKEEQNYIFGLQSQIDMQEAELQELHRQLEQEKRIREAKYQSGHTEWVIISKPPRSS